MNSKDRNYKLATLWPIFMAGKCFLLVHSIFLLYSSLIIISGQYLETRISDTKLQNSGSSMKKSGDWVSGPKFVPTRTKLAPSVKSLV